MQENKMPQRRIIVSLVCSFILCFPISGFIYGFFACKDCGWSVLGRLFIGLVGTFEATICLGHDFETGDRITAIYVLDVVVFVLLNLLFYRFNKRKME